MKDLVTSFKLIATSALLLLAVTGCESTGGGGNAGSGTNYGTGMNNPSSSPVTIINPTTGASPGHR